MNRLRCHYCPAILNDQNRTKDHKIPRVRGGRGKDNYVFACRKCNPEKADTPYEEFIERRRPRPLGLRKPDGTFLQTSR